MAINRVSIPYPDFQLNDIIDPDETDLNNATLQNKINELVDTVNFFLEGGQGESGADQISLTPIPPFTAEKLQRFLNDLVSRLRSTSTLTGSSLIGTAPISGVTGNTVAEQLSSFKSLLDATNISLNQTIANLNTHKTSGDHDTRYYTKSQMDGTLQGKADKISTYTRSATDSMLSEKADKSTTYTRTEVDTFLGRKADKTTMESLLANKADKATTYTRADVDTLLSRKADQTTMNSLLANKADSNAVYTKQESDSRYTRITGDHKGTWQGLTPSGIGSETINGARLDKIEPEFKESDGEVSIQSGVQVVTSERVSGLASPYIRGRTLVNLTDERPISFLDDGWSLPTDTTNIEIISREEDKVTYLCDYPTNTFAIPITLEPGAQYVVSCILRGRLGITYSGSDIASLYYRPASETSDSVEYKSTTFQVPESGAVRLYISNRDSRREGKESCEMSNLQITKVSGYKSINNPMIEATGKNLLPPFMEWITAGGTSKVESEYVLVVEAKNNYEGRYLEVDVSSHTNYSLSVSHNGRIGVFKTDGATGIVAYTADQQLNFNSGDNNKVRVYFTSGNLVAGVFRFSNPQLEVGSEATPFEPQKKSRTYYPDLTLSSSEDGSVYDELLPNGEVIKRIESVVLDGSLDWRRRFPYVGFKAVDVYGVNSSQLSSATTSIASKYNGKILRRIAVVSDIAMDTFQWIIPEDRIAIAISNQDSGWGDDYTPTVDEIKAYFNGWKMYPSGSGFGTGDIWNNQSGAQKRWVALTAQGRNSNNTVATLPTEPHAEFSPYKLQYQLTEPRIEKVNPVGRVQLHKGDNQISVVEGFIAREKANVRVDSVNGYCYINSSTSALDHKTDSILRVYRDDNVDNKWTFIIRDESSRDIPKLGRCYARIGYSDYDPTATYYVDYIALPSEFTASIEHASLHVPTSLVSQMEKVEAILSDESIGQVQDSGISHQVDSLQGDMNNLQGEMQELFTSVDNGKNDLRTAIIGKGGSVSGAQPNSFAELVSGVNGIPISPILANTIIGTTTISSSALASSAINLPSDAIITFNYGLGSGTGYLTDSMIELDVNTNNGTVTFRRTASGNRTAYIAYQVIRFRDVKQVIHGTGTLRTASSAWTTHSITLPQSVNRNRSIVVVSIVCTTGSTTVTFTSNHLVRYYLSNNTTLSLGFTPNTASLLDWKVSYQIVEFN